MITVVAFSMITARDDKGPLKDKGKAVGFLDGSF